MKRFPSLCVCLAHVHCYRASFLNTVICPCSHLPQASLIFRYPLPDPQDGQGPTNAALPSATASHSLQSTRCAGQDNYQVNTTPHSFAITTILSLSSYQYIFSLATGCAGPYHCLDVIVARFLHSYLKISQALKLVTRHRTSFTPETMKGAGAYSVRVGPTDQYRPRLTPLRKTTPLFQALMSRKVSSGSSAIANVALYRPGWGSDPEKGAQPCNLREM